uniref:Protein-tyrosine phosphatase n=1 Tax=Bursaphelenchus xylophilus TaxID=6326 RepID=A0A1I7RY09_BURXY
MEELALIFLLVGLGLVLVVLVTVGILLYSWQRQRKRVHINKTSIPEKFDIESVFHKEKNPSYYLPSPIPLSPKEALRSPESPHAPKTESDGALCSIVVVQEVSEHSPTSPSPPQRPQSPAETLSIQVEEKPKPPRPHLKNLNMNRSSDRMEKVQENENERLYDEYEKVARNNTTFSMEVSQLHKNMRKNRFYDVLPYDYNRVILKGPEDYINASYIKDNKGRLRFIACQGPIGENETIGGRRDATIYDFWKLIWEQKVDCIVCLTQCVENLRPKCGMYWPEYAGEDIQIDDQMSMNLYCYTEDEISFQREIWLEKKGQGTRKVIQWQFKEWRDATVPAEAENLLAFLEAVRASNRKFPVLVHCSAGVGRTGVYIGLEFLLDCLAEETVIDVAKTVVELRNQRGNMVQNGEQYIAMYEVIALAIRKKSRAIG